MKSSVFGKTLENIRKHGYISFVTTDRRRGYFVLERNYYTKWFSENLLEIEINKTTLKIDNFQQIKLTNLFRSANIRNPAKQCLSFLWLY